MNLAAEAYGLILAVLMILLMEWRNRNRPPEGGWVTPKSRKEAALVLVSLALYMRCRLSPSPFEMRIVEFLCDALDSRRTCRHGVQHGPHRICALQSEPKRSQAPTPRPIVRAISGLSTKPLGRSGRHVRDSEGCRMGILGLRARRLARVGPHAMTNVRWLTARSNRSPATWAAADPAVR